ncbi:Putative metal-dependent hydrolase YfiT [Phycisphaerales bacterium]|nr:Putative metal-dependent hydrolase YfiT [Phycisphaerales bacterium]
MSHDSCCGHDHNDTHDEHAEAGCCGGSGKSEGGCCKTAREPLVPMTAEQLEALPTDRLIARYRRGIESIDRRVFELSERQIDQAYLPDAGVGRWPIRVLIGHVVDADLAAVHRMRRAVAEDNPVFSEWDENAFVDANIYGNDHEGYADSPEGDHARVMNALGGFLATLHTLRQWTSQWLFSLSESQLDRGGMHPTRGVQSVRKIVALYTWHLEHHCGFLTRKLDLLVGAPEPADTAAGAGGCGCGH